jgi:hypothetical protein
VGAARIWGAYGVSYGTYLALTLMRDHADWTGPSGLPNETPPEAGFSFEADDGTRTRYLQLGKLSLYPVSYVREGGGRA